MDFQFGGKNTNPDHAGRIPKQGFIVRSQLLNSILIDQVTNNFPSDIRHFFISNRDHCRLRTLLHTDTLPKTSLGRRWFSPFRTLLYNQLDRRHIRLHRQLIHLRKHRIRHQSFDTPRFHRESMVIAKILGYFPGTVLVCYC